MEVTTRMVEVSMSIKHKEFYSVIAIENLPFETKIYPLYYGNCEVEATEKFEFELAHNTDENTRIIMMKQY